MENEFLIIKNKVNKNHSSKEIITLIESFVSRNIFHGLCETKISLIDENLTILETGFEEHQIISSKYIIRVIFTTVYKNSFFKILEEHQSFIKNIICQTLDNLENKSIKFNIILDDDEIEINY